MTLTQRKDGDHWRRERVRNKLDTVWSEAEEKSQPHDQEMRRRLWKELKGVNKRKNSACFAVLKGSQLGKREVTWARDREAVRHPAMQFITGHVNNYGSGLNMKTNYSLRPVLLSCRKIAWSISSRAKCLWLLLLCKTCCSLNPDTSDNRNQPEVKIWKQFF